MVAVGSADVGLGTALVSVGGTFVGWPVASGTWVIVVIGVFAETDVSAGIEVVTGGVVAAGMHAASINVASKSTDTDLTDIGSFPFV